MEKEFKYNEKLVEEQSTKTLEIAEAGPIWNKNPFPRIKKEVGVPTVQLEQA